MSPRATCLGVLIASLVSGRPAAVAGKTPNATQAVPVGKVHVDLGVEAYLGGRYAEAVREFELAYRLSSKPQILFNIARAEAKLGHEEAAIAFLKRYLEELPDAEDAAAVRAEVEARERAMAAARAH